MAWDRVLQRACRNKYTCTNLFWLIIWYLTLYKALNYTLSCFRAWRRLSGGVESCRVVIDRPMVCNTCPGVEKPKFSTDTIIFTIYDFIEVTSACSQLQIWPKCTQIHQDEDDVTSTSRTRDVVGPCMSPTLTRVVVSFARSVPQSLHDSLHLSKILSIVFHPQSFI